MRSLKYRELKRLYELEGADRTVHALGDALNKGELQPEEFSIRELAEITLGTGWVKQLDPRGGGGVNLMEAGDAVDVTAFSNITGQIIYNRIMQAYTQEAFILSRLVDTVPTRFDGEKIPASAGSSMKPRKSGRGCPIRTSAWARTTSKRPPPPNAVSSCR